MWQLFLILVLLGIWAFRRHRKMTLLSRLGFKGPKPHFIFGHLNDLFRSDNNVKTVSSWIEKYGDIVAYYIGTHPGLIVTDEELLKAVQIKDFQNFVERQLIIKGGAYPGEVTENHIISNKNKKRWKEMRSILTPTFNASKLKQMDSTINDAISELINNLTKAAGDGSTGFNIYPFFQGLTMDVIGRTAFGMKSGTQDTAEHALVEHSKKVLSVRPTIVMAMNIWFPELTFVIYPLRKLGIAITEMFSPSSFQYIHGVCWEILRQRRLNPSPRKDLIQAMIDAKIDVEDLATTKGTALTVNFSDMGDSHANDKLISGSIENTNGTKKSVKKFATLTDVEIVGNSFIFLEAGYETTSTTLAYVAHILVNHLDEQDRVRREVQDLLDKEGKLDYNSMSELPYMEAVIYETLRLYPPVSYFVNRVAAEDYHYKDMIIPKGTTILAPVPQIHRDPRFWEEPDKFDAMRFYKENKKKINPVHFQAFGTGPRNCIGMRFAILEIKLALAHLLTKFQLVPGPKTEIGDLKLRYKSNLVSPLHGVAVRAVPIE